MPDGTDAEGRVSPAEPAPVTEPTVVVSTDAAADAARLIADDLRAALAQRPTASLAVSGGSSAPPMLQALADTDLDWSRIEVWQVDERCAPDGDDDRNANQLAGFPAAVHLMPVTDPDLDAAAARYASTLPATFDVVHLGMGADGHTASWPPGDPVIDDPRPVALSRPYQGRVRMTVTPGVVNGARRRIVLIPGADKADALRTWLDHDDSPHDDSTQIDRVPIDRVTGDDTTVIVDSALARAAHLT